MPEFLFNSKMDAKEGCSVICDVNGNLIFYTNGQTIWNREHKILPNGENLGGGISSSQSSIIVPQPEDENIYYIFTVDDADGINGLRYSVLDIRLDNGLGDIVPDKKNKILLPSTCEKITAVKHTDNSSVWVIAHEYLNPFFHAWLIDKDGFHIQSVRTSIGTSHSPTEKQRTGIPLGCMKVSQAGNKLAVAIQYLNIFELFDFNNKTGVISNHIILSDDKIGPYGVEFSPDERFLYGSSRQNNEIYQWDLESANIEASLKVIGTTDGANGSLQLAPDGKIYLASYFSEYLGVINSPDSLGIKSKFVEQGFYLEERYSGEGLPNMISSIPFQSIFEMNNYCFGDTTKFKLIDTSFVDSIRWNFNYTIDEPGDYSYRYDTTHIFSKPGVYHIELITSRMGKMDTIVQSLKVYPYPVITFGKDTTGCTNIPMILNAGESAGEILWNNGSSDPFLEVNQSGKYSINVRSNNCISEQTIQVNFIDAPQIYVDTIIPSNCNESTGEIIISVLNAGEDPIIIWDNINQTDLHAKQLQSGVYSVRVIGDNGCISINDTIVVNDYGAPEIDIASDTDPICYGSVVKLSAGNANYYEWSNGETSREIFITATENIDVWVVGTNNNGCSNASILSLEVFPLPESNIIQERSSCLGKEISLNAGENNYDYLWSTRSTENKIDVTSSGIYNLVITDSIGCSNSYDINVTFFPKPRLNIGEDRAICLGDTVILDAGEGESYIWNTFETSREKIVTTTGNYRVIVFNEFLCEGKDEIYVQANDPEKLIITAVNREELKCLGDSNAVLNIEAEGNWEPLLYSIDSGINFYDNGGLFKNLRSDTIYTVAIKEEGACFRMGDSYSFEDPDELLIRTSILSPSCENCQDGSITVLPSGGKSPYFYNWSNFWTTNKRDNLSEGIYSIGITDSNKCRKFFTVELSFEKSYLLDIPSAFTPNADGINDFWKLKNKEYYPEIQVKVFSSHGKEIFSSPPGYPDPWDGTFEGSPLPTDSYFYFINFGPEYKAVSGNITLIR